MIDLLVRPEARAFISAQDGKALAGRLREALRVLERSRSQAALLLTCDDEIRTLNRNYRKLDRATDVLSFHQHDLAGVDDPAGDGAFLGDIVISVETAKRRAGGRRLPGELARLAIHGLCHLFGHDHHRPGPAKEMRRIEQRLLRASRGSKASPAS
jgi:probable rRNA maturation factor